MAKVLLDTRSSAYCQNVYLDLDGTVRPRKFPKVGLWLFDGQVFYLPRAK